MKHILRKTIVYLISILLTLSLVGCGSTSSDDDVGTDSRRENWGETTEQAEETTELTTVEESTKIDATKTEADKTSDSDSDDKASTDDNASTDDKTSSDDSTASAGTDGKSDASGSSSDTAGDEDDNISTNKSTGGKLIVLDPGHSNVVTGNTEPLGPGSGEMKAADSTGTHGVSSGLSEIELNFQVATKLKTELEARGYTVLMTRYDNNTAISCSERAQIANNAGADAFIRIHADGSESSSSSGAMAICITPSNPYTASTYSASRKLSDAVLNAYVASTGFSSRGVWETDTMTGNNWSNVPCTLIEMGFMTNPNEDSLMADSAFQQKIVTGIANGIDNYFAN